MVAAFITRILLNLNILSIKLLCFLGMVDGYFNDKSGQSQRHYSEEAIHGISQDVSYRHFYLSFKDCNRL